MLGLLSFPHASCGGLVAHLTLSKLFLTILCSSLSCMYALYVLQTYIDVPRVTHPYVPTYLTEVIELPVYFRWLLDSLS